ncbi:MAG TPA: response regulator transcription factor [Gaiellaceae bacterium]|nr:response regulator transcription factor [Gaiellaceae bacterium]
MAGKRVRVLIVDDHELFAGTLRLFLDGSDAVEVVGVAHDGAQAVDLALAQSPEVILMDVGLPGLDGFAAAKRLLGLRNGTKIVALSGRTEDEVRREVESAGMVGYLSKDHVDETVVDAILHAASL